MSSPTDLPFGVGSGGAPEPAPQSQTRLHDRVEALLAEYGLTATADDEGDFTFQIDENQLYVKVNEEGAGFVRVFGQWRMVDGLPGGPLEWFTTAARVTMEIPLVKVIVVPEGLIVACDAVSPPDDRLDVVLRMLIENVLHGVNYWHQYLFDAAEQAEAGGGRHRAPLPDPDEAAFPANDSSEKGTGDESSRNPG